jgi:uncharacterized protein (TIGR00296 family)
MVEATEGALLVQWARSTIEQGLRKPRGFDAAELFGGPGLPDLADEKRGVFVTLLSYPSERLRGCVGYPVPVYPLRVGLPRAALAAAREDTRFPPLRPEELPRTLVEVSLLTPPERVPLRERSEIFDRIRLGRDGLIANTPETSGLLLPQVPVEEGWDVPTFVRATCRKAGLSPEAWRDPRVEFYRFQSEIFRESRPGGPVVPRRWEVPEPRTPAGGRDPPEA